MKILVVDDDIDFADTLADILALAGHQVSSLPSGEEAVEFATQNEYDLILMDVKLPGINGVESTMRIRDHRGEIPVLIMTGYGAEQMLNEVLGETGWSLIHRPPDPESMVSRIHENNKCRVFITIIDRNGDFGPSLRERLERDSRRVLFTTEKDSLPETIDREKPDILILDLRRPMIEGLFTFLEISHSNHIPRTVLIVGLEKNTEDLNNPLHSFDLTGVLHKPFNPDTLLGIVGRMSA